MTDSRRPSGHAQLPTGVAPPAASLLEDPLTEKAVLGAMLSDLDAARTTLPLLDDGVFTRDEHRRLFRAMTMLMKKTKKIDPVLLRDELAQLGDLEAAGGAEYLVELRDAVPTAANVVLHAGILRRRAAQRAALRRAQELVTAMQTGAWEATEDAAAGLADLLHAATNGTGPAFDPPLLADFVAANPVQVDWVIEGYAARGTVTVFAGHPKVGKTTFTSEGAGAVASGGAFLGRQTNGGRVLWLDLEQHAGLTAAKLQSVSVPDAPLHLWTELPNWAAVASWCRQHDVRLVVLDSLAKVWPADLLDENDAVAVERALRPLIRLARDAGVALWVLAHLRKSAGAEGLDVRGSSAIAASTDILVSFKRYNVESEVPDPRRVLTGFSRYQETPAKLVVEYLDGHYRLCGTPGEVRRHEESVKVLRALDGEPRTAEDVANAAGLSPSAARTVLKQLAKDGRARRVGTGKKGDAYRYAQPDQHDDGDEVQPEVDMRSVLEAGA